jgi:hypothetical protein
MRSTGLFEGLDSLDRREQPQRRVQSQDFGATRRRLGIRTEAALLQNALKFTRNRVQPGLLARSVSFAAVDCPPVGGEAFHDLQTYSVNCFSGGLGGAGAAEGQSLDQPLVPGVAERDGLASQRPEGAQDPHVQQGLAGVRVDDLLHDVQSQLRLARAYAERT